MIEEVDVVVVGAGPVGLLAAIELTLGGVNVAVLERLAEPSTTIKALSVGPLGCEALARRGLGVDIEAAEARSFEAVKSFTAQSGSQFRSPRFSGHFAGLALLRKDAQREPERHARIVDQQSVEAMLTRRARSLGIEIRRGWELTGLEQDVTGVSCRGTSELRCSHLVGCDGGRSTVRKLAGFPFPGTDPSMTMFQLIAEIDHPERLLPAGWRRTAAGVFAYGPFPGRLFMLDFSGPPADRAAPVTRHEAETVLRRISGADVRITQLHVANRWTDNTRLVDSYRQGRVLLAGDAAHVHSPFGGQGLSLGLVDAANLGPKLAAVVRGHLPDSMLDTYTAERRPVARGVLDNTLAQLALMRPDTQSGALREIFAQLLELDDVNRSVGEMTNGLATRYPLESPHDQVGCLLGDRPVGDTTLYELMQDGNGVFLDATGNSPETPLGERIRRVAVDEGPSMLIRPDACLAWMGEGSSTDGLQAACQRWFGAHGAHQISALQPTRSA